MKNVSDKSCTETRKTVLCSITSVFENRAVYEIMWKNVADRGMPQMTICRMPIACWIPKATNPPTGCVILTAFPLQQWLHESASLLRSMYNACLVNFAFINICLYTVPPSVVCNFRS